MLAGCGSATVERAGAPIVPDRPSPPITAVDEAPPDDVQWFLKDDFAPPPESSSSSSASGGSVRAFEMCWSDSTSESSECPAPTPEQLAKSHEAEEQYRKDVLPASGSQPMVVAKLALASGDDELFTAWHNAAGELCWETDAETPSGGGGGGPVGPCANSAYARPGLECAALCLDSQGGSSGDAELTCVLTGTVPASASAIRVATADGQVSTYALDGPVVDRDRRVLMLVRLRDLTRRPRRDRFLVPSPCGPSGSRGHGIFWDVFVRPPWRLRASQADGCGCFARTAAVVER